MADIRQDLADLRVARDTLEEIDNSKERIQYYESELKKGVDYNPNIDHIFQYATDEGVKRKLQAEKEYDRKTKGAKTTVCAIAVLLNLAIFAYSIYALLFAPELQLIKSNEFVFYIWLGHIAIGLILAFLPIAVMKRN